MNIAFYVKTYNGVKGGIERLVSMLVENLPLKYSLSLFLDCEKWEEFPYKLNRTVNIFKMPFRGDCFFVDHLREIVIRNEIEAVVVMRTGSNVMQTWAAALGDTNCKLILSEHCEPITAEKEYPKLSRNISLECADYIHLLQKDFIKSIPENLQTQVKVIPNYLISLKREITAYSFRKNQIVMVGRLTKTQKRPMLLLEAFQQVCSIRKDISENWKLIFCGDGPEKEQMLKFIQINGMTNVEILGQVEDVDSILSDSKLFCLPSRYEGQSIALMEAMNNGCIPIVFANASGNNTMIEDNSTGYLSDDVLADTIIRAIDSNNNDEISKNANKYVQQYSMGNSLDSWNEFFKKIGEDKKLFRNRHLIKKNYLINILAEKELFL